MIALIFVQICSACLTGWYTIASSAQNLALMRAGSLCFVQALDSRTSMNLATPSNREQAARTGGEARARTRIKAVVNVGRVELEMLRTLKQHRSIEPLARFQVQLLLVDVLMRPDLVYLVQEAHLLPRSSMLRTLI